jgi:pyruvate/2-oxoacid:ferredoxin oxidoreductase beta subunit
LVQAAGAKFTKQVEDKNLQELIQTIKDAINFPGFAHIEVKQACPSWKKW